MPQLKYAIIAALILSSCSQETTNPVGPTPLSVIPPSDTIDVFVQQVITLELTILSAVEGSAQLSEQDTNLTSFRIEGPWFVNNSRQKIFLYVTGTKVTQNPTTVLLTVRIGDQTCQVPITVRVFHFGLVNSFDTNAPNDTIPISKAGTFLLRITCRNVSGKIVSKEQIDLLNLGVGYSWHEASFSQKLTASPVYRDTTNYYFLLSTFPDIVPSDDDSLLAFSFYLSDLKLFLPVKINY